MKHVADRLQAYVDGELSRRERELIAQHCADCPACARKLDELQKLWALIAAPEVPPLKQPLRPRISRLGADRVQGDQRDPAPAPRRVRPSLMRTGLATAALAAGFAVGLTVGGLGVGFDGGSSPGDDADVTLDAAAGLTTLLEESASLADADWSLDQLWLTAGYEEESGS